MSVRKHEVLGICAQPLQYWLVPILPSTVQGGPSSPRQRRISAAKEASVLFSPLVGAVYGKTGPVRLSWAIEREAVASGEAEPIDVRCEDSVVSVVCARSLFLAGDVRSCGVKVRLRGVREKGQRDQQAGRRLRIPGH